MIPEKLLLERALPPAWGPESGDWNRRRMEIRQLLQREIYGFLPEAPEQISFTELPTEWVDTVFCAGKAPLKRIRIDLTLRGKTFSFPICAVIPKNKTNLPFFISINFRDNVPDKAMPAEEIVDNGFAVFSFCYKDVTSDDGDFENGLAALLYEGRERTGSDCGKIALWSWAASRVMDYCRTLSCLDFEKAAVVGHSRLGKTALLTGMMDERFRFVFSNDSGCAGAAISRGKVGETVGKIFETFPYWFAPNYGKYSGAEEAMPFDQHFLLAACAPRYVYVASAEEDTWADPVSEYLSCCAASQVYEKLGLKGFSHPDRLPVVGDVFGAGTIGYHLRSGCHYFSREDWNHFFRFMDSK